MWYWSDLQKPSRYFVFSIPKYTTLEKYGIRFYIGYHLQWLNLNRKNFWLQYLQNTRAKLSKRKRNIYWSSFCYMTRIIAMSTFPETFVLIKAILRKPDGKKISKNGVYIDIDLYRTCLHFLSRRIYDFILICSSITLFISPRSSVGGNCFFFKNLQTSVKFFTAKHEKC